MKDIETRQLPTESIATRSSAWLLCTDGENIIRAWSSFFSGKEIIYLNDTIVSEQRSLKRENNHVFKNGNDTYEVKYYVVDQIMGTLECWFFKNGALLKAFLMKFKRAFKITALPMSGKRALLIILYAFMLGLLYYMRIFPAHISILIFLLISLRQLIEIRLAHYVITEIPS